MTILHTGLIVDDEPVCPGCGYSVDGIQDNGLCEICNESPRARSNRIRSELSNAFLDGRPMDSSDY